MKLQPVMIHDIARTYCIAKRPKEVIQPDRESALVLFMNVRDHLNNAYGEKVGTAFHWHLRNSYRQTLVRVNTFRAK